MGRPVFKYFAVLKGFGRHLPVVLMGWSAAFGIFALGFLVSDRQWFPYEAIAEAKVNAKVAYMRLSEPGRIRAALNWTDVAPADLQKRRIEVHHEVDDGAAFLLTGGEGQFLEYCPE